MLGLTLLEYDDYIVFRGNLLLILFYTGSPLFFYSNRKSIFVISCVHGGTVLLLKVPMWCFFSTWIETNFVFVFLRITYEDNIFCAYH